MTVPAASAAARGSARAPPSSSSTCSTASPTRRRRSARDLDAVVESTRDAARRRARGRRAGAASPRSSTTRRTSAPPPCSCARSRRCGCCGRGRAGSRSTRGWAAATTSRCSSKAFASAFFGTPLASMLAGRDTLVVCGATHVGLRARDGRRRVQHGLAPIVPRECVGDRWPAAHERTSSTWRRNTATWCRCQRRSARCTRPGSARPRTPDSHSATPITPSRSTPVSIALALEQVEQVLGGDVAGRARRERAAAEAADRRVEQRRARLQPGVGVRVAGVARVVQVQADRDVAVDGPQQPLDLPGTPTPIVSASISSSAARHPSRVVDDHAGVDAALERAAEGRRQVTVARSPRAWAASMISAAAVRGLLDAHVLLRLANVSVTG